MLEMNVVNVTTQEIVGEVSPLEDMILADVSPDTNPNLQETELFDIVRNRRTDLISRAANQGTDLNHRNVDGNTALHIAAASSVSCTRELLNHGARVDIYNLRGFLPIHNCTMASPIDLVHLLAPETDLLDSVDGNGYTLYHKCVISGHADTCKMLKEMGSDPFKRNSVTKESTLYMMLNSLSHYFSFNPIIDMKEVPYDMINELNSEGEHLAFQFLMKGTLTLALEIIHSPKVDKSLRNKAGVTVMDSICEMINVPLTIVGGGYSKMEPEGQLDGADINATRQIPAMPPTPRFTNHSI